MGACKWDENGVVEITSDESREWMPVPLIAVLLVKLAVGDVLISIFGKRVNFASNGGGTLRCYHSISYKFLVTLIYNIVMVVGHIIEETRSVGPCWALKLMAGIESFDISVGLPDITVFVLDAVLSNLLWHSSVESIRQAVSHSLTIEFDLD
jgi:hypothetical protein